MYRIRVGRSFAEVLINSSPQRLGILGMGTIVGITMIIASQRRDLFGRCFFEIGFFNPHLVEVGEKSNGRKRTSDAVDFSMSALQGASRRNTPTCV
jgi:hypothetical protein